MIYVDAVSMVSIDILFKWSPIHRCLQSLKNLGCHKVRIKSTDSCLNKPTQLDHCIGSDISIKSLKRKT